MLLFYVDSSFPFEELIDDLHDLIINDYLDPLACFLLAFTSKRYFQRLKFREKLMIDWMVEFISKVIGVHGSARQLVWFQQNLERFVDFEVVIRRAVVVGNMSLLTQFRWEEDLSGSERALRCTIDQGASFRYSMVKLSGHIGYNGTKSLLDHFLLLGLQVDWPTFVEGALLGGRLSLVEEYHGIFGDLGSFDSFTYASLCGSDAVLEYVVRSKKLTFTHPPGADETFIDLDYLILMHLCENKVFEALMVESTTHEGRFWTLLAFLHGRGIKFSTAQELAEKILLYVITCDLPECAVYLEQSEQLLSGSVVPRTYFAIAIGLFGFRCSFSRVCKVYRSYMPGFITMDELNNFFDATLIRKFSEEYLLPRCEFFEFVDLMVDPEMKLYPLPDYWLKSSRPPCNSHSFMESPEFAHFVERLLQHRICIPFRVMKRLVMSINCGLDALQRIVELFMPLYQLGQQLGLISGDRSGKKSLDLFEAALRRPDDDLIPLFNILLTVGHKPVDLVHLFGRILIAIFKKELTMKRAVDVSKFFNLPEVLTQADIDAAFRYVSPGTIAMQ